MQSVSVSEIVTEVKIILNENIAHDPVLSVDANQLELEEMIRARIVDAVRLIHESAPSDMLDDGIDIASSPVTLQDGSGYIALPADFMRLVIFQLETWSRPVVTPISDTDPRYFMQKSRFLGIRGGTDKPVCAITTGVNGRVLEFFSIAPGTTAVILKAKYLPLPTIENDAIKICKKLKAPIQYECAGLTALSFKDEIAKSFFEIAKSYI